MSSKPDIVELENYCGYCGERLPALGGGEMGACPACRKRFVRSADGPRYWRAAGGPGGGSFGSGPEPIGRGEPLRRPEPVYKDAVLAALLSTVLPGAGQFYNLQFLKGILILLTSWLVIPYFIGIVDAYFSARRFNRLETAYAAWSG